MLAKKTLFDKLFCALLAVLCLKKPNKCCIVVCIVGIVSEEILGYQVCNLPFKLNEEKGGLEKL